MKRACYILTTIVILFSALTMFFTEGTSPFFAIVWANVFVGFYAAIGLVALLAILQIVLISLSHFKNGKYKYVVLAIWIVLLILNIIFALEDFAPIAYASPIITVVLMVLSFLCAKKSKSTDEYQPAHKKIILRILTVVIAVILSIFLMIAFMVVFGGIEEIIGSKIGLKKYIENEVQTPVSEEIADNFHSMDYEEIIGGWAMLDNKTAMLPYGFANFRARWIIANDPRFVIEVTYDTWDEIAHETPMISKDFEYPNVLTDTVTGVALIDWYPWDIFDNEECNKLELTPGQAETLRALAFSTYDENTGKERIQLNNDDWEFTDYGNIKTKTILWSYNDINAICYYYGEIIKNKDGNYYICTDLDWSYHFNEIFCTFYEKIPDDIALQIDAVFDE